MVTREVFSDVVTFKCTCSMYAMNDELSCCHCKLVDEVFKNECLLVRSSFKKNDQNIRICLKTFWSCMYVFERISEK